MIPEPSRPASGAAPAVVARRTVAFDYAFRYTLTGELGKKHTSTLTVSTEADFVAVSIGYGVVPTVTPIVFGPDLSGNPPAARRSTMFNAITFADVLAGLATALPTTSRAVKGPLGAQIALARGIRLNPAFAEQALLHIQRRTPLPPGIFRDLFQVVGTPPDEIQFLYALFDDGTGREFQSEPILNTAGLGAADGDRPFRYFPRPIVFTRQSTIRMDVTEASAFEGELHVALQGYKVLGAAGTPTGRATAAARRSRR
jgi:hypothetical protein